MSHSNENHSHILMRIFGTLAEKIVDYTKHVASTQLPTNHITTAGDDANSI